MGVICIYISTIHIYIHLFTCIKSIKVPFKWYILFVLQLLRCVYYPNTRMNHVYKQCIPCIDIYLSCHKICLDDNYLSYVYFENICVYYLYTLIYIYVHSCTIYMSLRTSKIYIYIYIPFINHLYTTVQHLSK